MSLRWSLCVLVGVLAVSRFQVDGGGFVPDERKFGNQCENCTVSNGFGFASHPLFCECYFTCVLQSSPKLANYSNPWVSYIRCCPCHMAFSMKLLTCVDYTDKRSDCFDDSKSNNPCSGQTAGETTLTQDPDNNFSYACSGFANCTEVGGVVVPDRTCCPDGTCYSRSRDTCDSQACTESQCASLREKDDCECEQTDAPERECAFVRMSSSIFQFMGRENMKVYDCAPGTCWDQNTCTCVRTNNTGYNDCSAFAELKFNNNELTARDNLGNTIWTEIYGNVNITGEEACFDYGYIGVSGLANTFLDDRFILHFHFEHNRVELPLNISDNYPECLLGSSLKNKEEGEERFNIAFETEYAADNLHDLEVSFTYKDTEYWTPDSETTETFTLELVDSFEAEDLDFWMFYGWNEYAIVGVIDGNGVVVKATKTRIPDAKLLLPPESGFIFGHCQEGNDFYGKMDNIEMFRGCKPYNYAAFNSAYNEVDFYLYYYYYYYYYY